jgi:hypothetical protein
MNIALIRIVATARPNTDQRFCERNKYTSTEPTMKQVLHPIDDEKR